MPITSPSDNCHAGATLRLNSTFGSGKSISCTRSSGGEREDAAYKRPRPFPRADGNSKLNVFIVRWERQFQQLFSKAGQTKTL